MTLILLLLATLFTSTSPVTIQPTHHHERTVMAQGNPGAPGGGANNQNRGRASHPAISYPIRHPNAPPPDRAGTTFNRLGRDAKNPMTFTEHTSRPTPHQ